MDRFKLPRSDLQGNDLIKVGTNTTFNGFCYVQDAQGLPFVKHSIVRATCAMRTPVRTGKEDLQLAAAISSRQRPESRSVLALIGLRQFKIRMVDVVFLHTINTSDDQQPFDSPVYGIPII